DGGKNWSKFTNNMPATAVHFIEMHPKTNDVVLGTHGRGVIIIDDISPLRQIDEELLAKDVHFFDMEPSVIVEQSGFGGGSTETQFVGPNPTRSAKIIYYLKKRHTFGKMTMHIEDQEGNVIAELTPGKSKGINVVTWNFTSKAPKMAKGKTFTFGGFTAPRVLPGTYTIVLNKGKSKYTKELVVESDPTSLLSEEERIAKHEVVKQLYDMSQDLAYMVYELDAIVERAEKLKEKSGGKKVAQPVIDELTSLKETLVITTGDNYVGAAEPQLRELQGDLYSKLASSYDKPTSAEMANLSRLKKRFDEAKASFDKIKNKEVAKMSKFIEKHDLEGIQILKFDEFVDSDL
ncbi:MAG: hypothetical protein R3345_11530, partial [Fulvivirga sp.]|nr:hypothetical protein [Fulvivirga sp.]